MTDQAPVNGRVTQRDLYDAIGGLRQEQRDGFAEIRGDFRELRERVAKVERCQTAETARDDERALIIREQQEMKREQGVSKRWLIALAAATFTSLAIALAPLVSGALAE